MLFALLGLVDTAAGKSNSLRKLSDLNLSPVRLIVAYIVLLLLLTISTSGEPPNLRSSSPVTDNNESLQDSTSSFLGWKRHKYLLSPSTSNFF